MWCVSVQLFLLPHSFHHANRHPHSSNHSLEREGGRGWIRREDGEGMGRDDQFSDRNMSEALTNHLLRALKDLSLFVPIFLTSFCCTLSHS